MNANVEFEAKIAIGIYGVALLLLSEKSAPGFAQDDELCCVKDDIEACGIGDWFECLSEHKPKEAGIYNVKGKGWFCDDDVEYKDIKFIQLREEVV